MYPNLNKMVLINNFHIGVKSQSSITPQHKKNFSHTITREAFQQFEEENLYNIGS